jgi:hypothetical protein
MVFLFYGGITEGNTIVEADRRYGNEKYNGVV